VDSITPVQRAQADQERCLIVVVHGSRPVSSLIEQAGAATVLCAVEGARGLAQRAVRGQERARVRTCGVPRTRSISASGSISCCLKERAARGELLQKAFQSAQLIGVRHLLPRRLREIQCDARLTDGRPDPVSRTGAECPEARPGRSVISTIPWSAQA